MGSYQYATAVTFFHPVSDGAGFEAWVADLVASARAARGIVAATASGHESAIFDRGVAVTFRTENDLHAWLDSADRDAVLDDGQSRGFWRSSADLLLLDGESTPPGTIAFRHRVAPGRLSDFRSVQTLMVQSAGRFPGFVGTALFLSESDQGCVSVVRFRTAEQLSRWLSSDERAAELGPLRSILSEEFASMPSTTPFATTVRTEHGKTLMTPNWKSAMLVLLVLYPAVMVLSRFLGPILDGLRVQPWLAMWLSQVVSVALLQWYLMPWISRPFRRWLDPVDGAGVRISIVGAAVVLAGYGVTLAVFAVVKSLQYWDFGG